MSKADLDLCYLSATEALARFKARSLSPVELCRALIKRNEDSESGTERPHRHLLRRSAEGRA